MTAVTVVVPCRNGAATLRETLQSILIAPEVGRIIVVDDGSTDGSAAVASSLGDARVQVVDGPCNGIAAAMNRGFDNVDTPFVARCDADDLVSADRFGWQLRFLSENADYVAVSSAFATLFPDGRIAGRLAADLPAQDTTDRLRNGDSYTTLCTFLTRTDSIRALGGARTWFRTAEDVDLQLRIADTGRVWHAPIVTYFYRLHDASITHTSARAALSFYDGAARAFARQRLANGVDALDAGNPPVYDPATQPAPVLASAIEQAIGHAVGTAWSDFERGARREAISSLAGHLRRFPASTVLWETMARMLLKSASRK